MSSIDGKLWFWIKVQLNPFMWVILIKYCWFITVIFFWSGISFNQKYRIIIS